MLWETWGWDFFFYCFVYIEKTSRPASSACFEDSYLARRQLNDWVKKGLLEEGDIIVQTKLYLSLRRIGGSEGRVTVQMFKDCQRFIDFDLGNAFLWCQLHIDSVSPSWPAGPLILRTARHPTWRQAAGARVKLCGPDSDEVRALGELPQEYEQQQVSQQEDLDRSD